MKRKATKKIAIAPAANWIGKQWSTERFAELAGRLSAPNGLFASAQIAVFAAEAERDQVQALFDNLPKDSYDDLVGVGDLSDVAHLLSRCNFFVGNDSGLMHMSAALGVPTLGLFGPSRTEHYAPWGRNAAMFARRNHMKKSSAPPDTTIAPREV